MYFIIVVLTIPFVNKFNETNICLPIIRKRLEWINHCDLIAKVCYKPDFRGSKLLGFDSFLRIPRPVVLLALSLSWLSSSQSSQMLCQTVWSMNRVLI